MSTNEERSKRLKQKMDKFMAETAEDYLDAETIETAQNTIKRIFKNENIPYTRSSLKAFSEGCMIATGAHNAGEAILASSILIAVKKLVDDFESKVQEQINKQKNGTNDPTTTF